jgi:hypothetical protein
MYFTSRNSRTNRYIGGWIASTYMNNAICLCFGSTKSKRARILFCVMLVRLLCSAKKSDSSPRSRIGEYQ